MVHVADLAMRLRHLAIRAIADVQQEFVMGLLPARQIAAVGKEFCGPVHPRLRTGARTQRRRRRRGAPSCSSQQGARSFPPSVSPTSSSNCAANMLYFSAAVRALDRPKHTFAVVAQPSRAGPHPAGQSALRGRGERGDSASPSWKDEPHARARALAAGRTG